MLKNEKPKISVIIPIYNANRTLEKLLLSLKKQTFRNFEIIAIDDKSTDNSLKIAKKHIKNIMINKKNLGPAKSRNRGIKKVKSDIIAFTDADCVVTKDWLRNIYKEFKNKNTQVLMGNVKIPKSTFLGNAISAQGFPGGGSIGFENMWHVSKEGYTDHITSCNFAVRKEVSKKYGGFDESFPFPGGEDPELSYRLAKAGVKIKYCPNIVVYHEPRTKFMPWVRWQILRGRTNYHFKKKVGNVRGFIKLRLWSSYNIIRKTIFSLKFPLVLLLLFLSFTLQQYGFFAEKMEDKKDRK